MKTIFKNLLLFTIYCLLFTAQTVVAADTVPPVVKIVKLPEYLNKRDFEISYTALDGGEADLKSVHLEYKKEGESWHDLGTYSEGAKKISVDSSKINSEAKYYFKATACDNNNNCAEDETFTNIDTSSPPQPENYSKEKLGVQSYKISWHNPDSDDLDKVYVYRDENKDWNADDSHKVAEISVSKNTDNSWTDSVVPDSSKTYYYAIRSVDKAGNSSEAVGDAYTVQEEGAVEGETVSSSETVSGQEPVYQGGEKTSQKTGGQILGKEKSATASASPAAPSQNQEKETEAEKSLLKNKNFFSWVLVVLAALIIIIVFYRNFKLKK